MMNLTFFYGAILLYLAAAAGYLTYFIGPERKRLADVSLWAAFLGFILHFIYFALRWSEAGHIPVTSFFEAVNALGMGIMLVFLIMELRYRVPSLGTFMLPLVLVLMAPTAFLSHQLEGVKPILKSAWLGVHTSLAMLGDAAFAFSFIVSIMYLLQERQLKHKRLGTIFHRLPPLDVMDTIGYRALSIGWPLFTLGMITGSIWAESAWGSYWSWDPKETWSLIVWLVYLVLLHLRTIGWRGRKMAYFSIAGFLFVLASFYVVSRVGVGKHSF
jgi:cytochrome c-type biogenesis protein CcsB